MSHIQVEDGQRRRERGEGKEERDERGVRGKAEGRRG